MSQIQSIIKNIQNIMRKDAGVEYSTLSEARKREWFLKCTPQGGKEKILKLFGEAQNKSLTASGSLPLKKGELTNSDIREALA